MYPCRLHLSARACTLLAHTLYTLSTAMCRCALCNLSTFHRIETPTAVWRGRHAVDACLSMTQHVEAVLQLHSQEEAAVARAPLWMHLPHHGRGIIAIAKVILAAANSDIEVDSCSCMSAGSSNF